MTLQYLVGNEVKGLSSDTKPTLVQVGTIFTETDTNRKYEWSGSVWNWLHKYHNIEFIVQDAYGDAGLGDQSVPYPWKLDGFGPTFQFHLESKIPQKCRVIRADVSRLVAQAFSTTVGVFTINGGAEITDAQLSYDSNETGYKDTGFLTTPIAFAKDDLVKMITKRGAGSGTGSTYYRVWLEWL